MSQPLYERYKDALRRGHVAGLRGRLDVALEAYAEASSLVPERALPHASMGAILRRLGRLDEARAAYDAAILRAPLDEGALRGRAAVLLDLGRRADAADDLERLAEALEAEGRVDDAADAARQALDLAESRSRRKLAERLAHRAAGAGRSDDDGTAREGLGSALSELVDRAGGAPDAAPVATKVPAAPELPTEAKAEHPEECGPRIDDHDTGGEDEPLLDPVALRAEADALLEAGDIPAARPVFLGAMRGFAATGRPDAAVDTGFELLGVAPADPELHLALAEIQLRRGWRAPASDKLRLLVRLAELTDDPATREAATTLAASMAGVAAD